MILLTRPEPDSKRVAPDFQNLGYQVMISPVLKIIPHPIVLPKHDALCFSSKNALPALKNVSKNTPIYCVGSHTLESLKDRGFCNVTTAPTARQLLEKLRIENPFKNLLYLAGNVSSLDFSEHLSSCHKLICYEAIAQKTFSSNALKALQEKHITHIPLYSERSIKILNQLLMKNKIDFKNIILLALSQDIAKQAEAFDFKEILIAADPTHQSLLNLLVGYKNDPEEK